MDNICGTCIWYDSYTMECRNDMSNVFMTGPKGSCPYWEGEEDT